MRAGREQILTACAGLAGLALLVVLVVRAVRAIDEIDAALARPLPAVAPASLKRPDVQRQVRFANRIVTLPERGRAFPARFAEHQTPSARGTAPYVVVSEAPVTREIRARAAACGARVLGFMPVNALVVEIDAAALRKLSEDVLFAGAGEFLPADKIQKDLLAGAAETVEVSVTPLTAADREPVAKEIAAQGGVLLPADGLNAVRVQARLSRKALEPLARRGDVRWIERRPEGRLQNDVAVNAGLMNVRVVWDTHGLTGAGQNIVTSDSGIDTGERSALMADFEGRVWRLRAASASCPTADVVGHGTHTAGSLVGTGALSDGEIRGVAHGARIYAWAVVNGSGFLEFPCLDALLQPDPLGFPSYLHSGSWGQESMSAYSVWCIDLDDWLWRHPETLAVFSAGNNGSVSGICAPGGAKNTLCVGATESVRPGTAYAVFADNASAVARLSARGPMTDGRVKPDLVAPGTMILSTRTTLIPSGTTVGWASCPENGNYTYDSGTSMATPLVAGAAALARQWLVERKGCTNEPPTGALLKAVLTGGAHDLAWDAGADCGGGAPNNVQGWGRVDLGETLYPSGRAVRLVDRIPFTNGMDFIVRVTVTNTAPLDIQLAWFDHPGASGAAQALVNDLDLEVVNEETGARWLGNDRAGTGVRDTVNTLESVRVSDAEPAVYAIHVKGTSVPYDCFEGGAAALYIRGAFAEETRAPETVALTVTADGAETGGTLPASGTWRVTKGVPIRLEAMDAVRESGENTVMRRRRLVGWTGSGDVPSAGTDGSVIVSLAQDSAIAWRWAQTAQCRVRRVRLIPSYGNFFWGDRPESWIDAGTTLAFTVPADIPEGAETFDLSGRGFLYTDEDGAEKPMKRQRLGRIEVAETDADAGVPVLDAAGRMARAFSVTVTNGTDILFSFWDTAATNAATGLPTWWYNQHLREAGLPADRLPGSADADGDGLSNAGEYAADTDPLDPASDFRILALAPTGLVWRGGRERTQVVERSDRLGEGARWTGVFTNLPPTETEGRCAWPESSVTNSFYRVRAF